MKLKKQEKAADTSLWKIMQQSPHKPNILAWFLAQHYDFFSMQQSPPWNL